MHRLLVVLVAAGALAQSPDAGLKLREAQQAFGAGDCGRAQAALRDIIAADPQNYVAHLLSAHCFVRQKDYPAAAAEFRRTLEIRPDTQQGVLGLIQVHALSGDVAHRDAEIARLRALIDAGKIPRSVRFVREQFTVGGNSVVASEYVVTDVKAVLAGSTLTAGDYGSVNAVSAAPR